MADIATVWRDWGGAWQVQGPALLADDGLATSIVLSLFTDRVAEPGDMLPGGPTGRRGWWGDAYADVPGDRIGSRLWLLVREKVQPAVLRRAELYAKEALQWLVDDGVASRVDVLAELAPGAPHQGLMALTVTVTRSAEPVAQYRFEAFWKGA